APLQRAESADGIDLLRREDRVERGAVADVGLREARDFGAERGEALQHFGRAVREVVDPGDPKARGLEREPRVRGDVAGGAGEQDHGGVAGHAIVGATRGPLSPRLRQRAVAAYNPRMLEGLK